MKNANDPREAQNCAFNFSRENALFFMSLDKLREAEKFESLGGNLRLYASQKS